MKKDSDYTLSNDEKYKFLDALKHDCWFREQMYDTLSETGDIYKFIREEIYGACPTSVEVVNDILDDVVDVVFKKIQNSIIEKVKKEINFRKIENSAVEKLLKDQENLTKDIVEKVASDCFILQEKEQLIKGVKQEMVKRNSYRTDLLDLDK